MHVIVLTYFSFFLLCVNSMIIPPPMPIDADPSQSSVTENGITYNVSSAMSETSVSFLFDNNLNTSWQTTYPPYSSVSNAWADCSYNSNVNSNVCIITNILTRVQGLAGFTGHFIDLEISTPMKVTSIGVYVNEANTKGWGWFLCMRYTRKEGCVSYSGNLGISTMNQQYSISLSQPWNFYSVMIMLANSATIRIANLKIEADFGILCAAGQKSNTGYEPCTLCEAGKFASSQGSIICNLCFPGHCFSTLYKNHR